MFCCPAQHHTSAQAARATIGLCMPEFLISRSVARRYARVQEHPSITLLCGILPLLFGASLGSALDNIVPPALPQEPMAPVEAPAFRTSAGAPPGGTPNCVTTQLGGHNAADPGPHATEALRYTDGQSMCCMSATTNDAAKARPHWHDTEAPCGSQLPHVLLRAYMLTQDNALRTSNCPGLGLSSSICIVPILSNDLCRDVE